MESSDPVDTPMVEKSKLDEDTQGIVIDPTHYHGMVGTLMYLTASRLDLTFAIYRLVSWSSKRQKSTAISSKEAEYIALSGYCAQVLWMRSQLTDYGIRFNKIPMYCDKKALLPYAATITSSTNGAVNTAHGVTTASTQATAVNSTIIDNQRIRHQTSIRHIHIIFGEPPCPFDYPMRRLTMEEMLAKFIDEGRRKHEEMDIFIKEFRTTNELLLKTRSNLLSELKIEITSEATHSKESNEIGVNENKPPRFEQDVQEKPHDDGVENKSSKKDPRSFTTPCQVLEKHKEAEDLAANHLSRFENPHMEVLTEREIANKFSGDHLMMLKSKFNDVEPWYADFVNYIVGKVVPSRIRSLEVNWDQQVVSELVALRNFVKKKLLLHSRSVCYKEMDQDSAHMVAASKVPMLKPGEYELWRMRMEQYIQMIDYSLWEVIENGNAPPITKVVEGVETTIAPTTAKEKHKEAVKKSSEVLDQTFDRLQKLISQLEIHGESILQEDVNQKFLRSLSPEWNTHTIVWRNKPEIDTLSLDDLYNNLKIYELEVKGTSSSSTNTQNVAFVSSNSTSSTNGAVNTAHGATTAST
ncbi:hypothetical protein Tco_1466851 [Tanacetum coccineum]